MNNTITLKNIKKGYDAAINQIDSLIDSINGCMSAEDIYASADNLVQIYNWCMDSAKNMKYGYDKQREAYRSSLKVCGLLDQLYA